MSALDLRTIARALDGEITAGKVIAPAPGHSLRDRSLWVIPSWQAPDGFRVHCFSPGDDWREARDYVRAKLGIDPNGWRYHHARRERPVPVYTAPEPDQTARIARAVRIWNEAGDARGTLAEVYLRSRGLGLPDGAGALRYHARTPWRDDDGNVVFVPCMIAAMRAIDGDAVTGIQRTRLTSEGAKIGRRMLGVAAGSAVKLDADTDVTQGLAVGEGVESVLAARDLGFRPAWAIGSAGAIAGLSVLPGVEAITLLGENDPASDRAIGQCAERWHTAGREVTIVTPNFGSDMADVIGGAA